MIALKIMIIIKLLIILNKNKKKNFVNLLNICLINKFKLKCLNLVKKLNNNTFI